MEKLQFIRTDRNGTKIYHDWNCPRCGGAGQADNWKFTGLICYGCGGTGKRKTPQVVKEYTPEYREKLDEKARERQEKAHKIYLENLPEINARFLARHGFAEDGTGYVFTGNTYEIKDDLKRGGARFNNYLHWVAPHPIGDHPCIIVKAEEVCNTSTDEEYTLNWVKCGEFKEKHGLDF